MDDPDLREIWATQSVFDDSGDPPDEGVFLMAGAGACIVFWYDRPRDNVRVLALDDAGRETMGLFVAWMATERASMRADGGPSLDA